MIHDKQNFRQMKNEAIMLRLKPYNKNDAEIIMSWIKDESAFYKWTAGVL